MSVPDGLLVLLRDGPRHGYQLATEFAERTADRWSLNTGQVYTTLDRLVRDGFVEPDGGAGADPRRRAYRLTPAGALRAETWLVAPPPAPDDQRDELVLRVLLTAAVAPAAAVEVVDRQRRQLVERLQELRRHQRSAADQGLVARMAADAAATRLEADLRWLDLCEERLRAVPNEEDPR